MQSLLEHFKTTLNRYHVKRAAIAFSGGVDSRVLLGLCVEANIDCIALHVNHKLRGVNADEDELFCRNLCKKLNIQFASMRIDIKQLAQQKKCGIEEAGRIARHSLYLAHAPLPILLAHHNDDQSETIRLRWREGKIPSGMSEIVTFSEGFTIIRPLLSFTKSSLIEYAVLKNWTWREDQTNSDIRFLRNAARHNFDIMQQYIPQCRLLWIKAAELIDRLDRQFIEKFQHCFISYKKNSIVIDDRKLPEKCRKRVTILLFEKVLNRPFTNEDRNAMNGVFDSLRIGAIAILPDGSLFRRVPAGIKCVRINKKAGTTA